MHKKHKHELKRKKKRESLKALPNRTKITAEMYYRKILKDIKKYPKSSPEYRKLHDMKTVYEGLMAKKKEAKKPKELPIYKVVKLTKKLDKLAIDISECTDEKKLEKLKIKRSLLKSKLNKK